MSFVEFLDENSRQTLARFLSKGQDPRDIESLVRGADPDPDQLPGRLFPDKPERGGPISPHLASENARRWTELVDQWTREGGTLQEATRRRIKGLARAGIPVSHRPTVWPRLLNSYYLWKENEKDLATSVYKEYLGLEVDEKVLEQIAKDIGRTMPAHYRFQEERGQKALFCVLKAFAAHDTEIAYCQGMNAPAALFLVALQFDERLAFWSFYRFLKCYGSMYTENFYGLRLKSRTLHHLLAGIRGDIIKHLQLLGLDLLQLTPGWFLPFFATTLPVDLALRIYDALFCEGPKMIYRAAIAIFIWAAEGHRLPDPSRATKAEYLQQYGERWPFAIGSPAYIAYFEAWAKTVPPGQVSLLAMPIEYAQIYLSQLPRHITDEVWFIDRCLRIKFTSDFLHKCEASAKADIDAGI
ncbi:Rab-GTPase-TBC domain-containing protein [Giardia muris]|uniref:Rab-GTPase-TBC domain-containing protein n=1 Tax=Giardia muris TaxID=5742 RepID=A0A4Z1SN45_GIAMU|nr:Rab-GTPase-TBC domain-containing protein [Giardia muris]|eukprot:TNJ26265.1 Rab-GTPase-TBC domain-containing protein [Giardia muris]